MITVAIVEDRKDVLDNLTKIVNSAPDMGVVGSYENSDSAIGGILLNRPQVVIMDIDLGPLSMNGIQCLEILKKDREEILFLMYTQFGEDKKLFEALELGASGYILKRDPIRKILENIRDVSQQGAPMSRSIAKRVLDSFRKEVKTKENELVEGLNETELKIIEGIRHGMTYRQIAGELDSTENAIKQRIHRIYKKLQVRNKVEAINLYLKGKKK